MISRRALVAGGAALALARPAIAAQPDLAALLDAAAAERDPARALTLLTPLRADRLAGAARLDLITARDGLAVDVALARHGVEPRAKTAPARNAAIFALLLRRKVGFAPSLAAIDRRLIAEQRLIDTRAQQLFDKLGIDGASTGARFARLFADPAGHYPDTDAGRDAAVADMNALLPRLAAIIPTLIGPVPTYCLNVAASRGSSAEQAAGKVGTRTLPTPNSPGSYVIDLTRIADRPSWSLPSVTAHELLPGHMLQLPIEAAAHPRKLRLDYAPAFAEAWSIHIEHLVADAGLWADPRAMLGYLHWRLFRIVRARIDIALHCHGWSIDQARARLTEWQGVPAYFAPFDSDLARIAAEPATRAAEMLAALAIEEGARGKRGPALIAFHQAMLVDGRMRSDEIARRARA
ncbi:MAG: hypothetical protein B7Y45_04840 [Sphingomonas sp. 28-66-16]|nr:MAG: hypothetical protein B7Y45_04840 [Sphingomonas sp. 28-66-16]